MAGPFVTFHHPPSVLNVANQNVVANDTQTTGSLTDVLVPSMTLTVSVTGLYLLLFEMIAHNGNTTGMVFASIYKNGVQIASSERHCQSNNDKQIVIHQAGLSLSAGDVIEIRWRVDGNTGTVHDRSLILLKLG